MRRVDLLLTPKSFNLITLSKKEHSFSVTLLDSLGKGEASCIAYARYSHCAVATDDNDELTIEKADQFLTGMTHAGFYSPVRRISDII